MIYYPPEARANFVAGQIAKVLDQVGVKPPLRPQAWQEIQTILANEFRACEEAIRLDGQSTEVSK